MAEPILRVKDLKKYYHGRGGSTVKAVDGVSFSLERGRTMALVGESGCGKSTTGRMLLRLAGDLTQGQVLFHGRDIYRLSKKELRQLRPKMQIIFQDPYSSLPPRMPVGRIIGEAVQVHGIVPGETLEAYVDGIMESCGLQLFHKNRYPHEFSGGQRQRICIARALALQPELIVCDEPVSALDVSVQAQIVNLLRQLQEERGLSYLFISHDLSVVEHISHTVGVMYLGRLVEYGTVEQVYRQPLHPYTEALLAAVPVPDPKKRLSALQSWGSLPSPADPPPGCPYHTRCPWRMELCSREVPAFRQIAPGHYCACHLHTEE